MSNAPTFLANSLLFVHTLRRAGIAVSLEQSISFIRALELINLAERSHVYHTARCLLVNRYEDLKLFDALFQQFWRVSGDDNGLYQRPRTKRPPSRHEQPFTVATYAAYKARRFGEERELDDRTHSFSASEVLQCKGFAQMTPEELQSVHEAMQQMRWQVSLRTTRRRTPSPQGDMLDLRRVLRNAARHEGLSLRLTWQRQKVKQRPIVLLADISGSMEKYTRILLQFFYSVSHSLRTVECFVFGTRLTRITAPLKLKNIDRALDDASREVVDWAGGTRIGESLQAFNQQWSRRVLRRGALVIIISDGWERGNVTALRQEMRFLHHRCHRLIWLNPLSSQTTYRPTVEGMAAALPFIDDFLPIHNLHNLHELAVHLRSLR